MAAWLPPSVNSLVRDEWKNGSHGYEVTGYSLEGEIPRNDAEDALKTLRELDRPAPSDFCMKELARLKMLTKSAKADGDDTKFQLAVMAEELSEYPMDAVKDACRDIAKRSTFFPAWVELKALCDESVLKRRCLIRALERYLKHRTAQDALSMPCDSPEIECDPQG